MSKIGLEMWTGRNTGTIASPVWDEIGPIKDESVEISKSLVDITTRLANGWRLQRGTLKDASVSMQLLYLPGDADFIALQTAFFADTKVVLGLLDGDPAVVGTYYGLHSAFNITKFTQPRNLEDAVVCDLEFVMDLETTTNTAPSWATIVTGA